MSKRLRLDRSRACVLVIDVQERLAQAMPDEIMGRVLKYTRALALTGKELGIPVVASEQYPKGLGATLSDIRETLEAPPLAKMHFSCCSDPGISQALQATGRKQVVVAGMETHVCVFQTVSDLVASGYEVFVCSDAVASRTEEHRQVGLALCREAGAAVTTAETVIFDLLQQAGTPEFKKLSGLVK